MIATAANPEDPLTPQQAAEILQLRRQARTSYRAYLKLWIRATHQPFIWGWHWDYLSDIMQAVADRDPLLQFLIVNIPPRMAKSTILSQQWQAWQIGRQDNVRSSVFSISSSATLAERDSRRTLETVKSEWYRKLFPNIEIGAKETAGFWDTKGGAYRIACGRDGTVTGQGAHHLIVDDICSAQEGDSETVREAVNEFLSRSMRSRLDDQKTGTITNIQQRLHERDATGTLLDLGKIPGGDQYHHIVIPNEAPSRTIVFFRETVYRVREQGELLHEQYLGRKETAALKASMRNNYEGQYQQNPVKMEGAHFDPRRLARLPGTALDIKQRLGLTPNIYMDFAGTEKQTQKNDPDFSVILVGAKDQLGRLHILDIWRKQTADYAMMSRMLIQMHKLWRPRFTKGEKGVLLNLFQTALSMQCRNLGHFLVLEPLPARRNDKVERSMNFQSMLNSGVVAVPEHAPWLADYERELRGFPNGAHDDQIDPSSDIANDYETLTVGEVPMTDPTDPTIVLNKEMVDRINRARERQLHPEVDADVD